MCYIYIVDLSSSQIICIIYGGSFSSNKLSNKLSNKSLDSILLAYTAVQAIWESDIY